MSVYEKEGFSAFKVSREILKLVKGGVLEETSWHNDTAPSFGTRLRDGTLLRLWVEHPNKDRREGSRFRYSVLVQDDFGDPPHETVVETDDLEEALFHLLGVIERRGQKRARFRLLGCCGQE